MHALSSCIGSIKSFLNFIQIPLSVLWLPTLTLTGDIRPYNAVVILTRLCHLKFLGILPWKPGPVSGGPRGFRFCPELTVGCCRFRSLLPRSVISLDTT